MNHQANQNQVTLDVTPELLPTESVIEPDNKQSEVYELVFTDSARNIEHRLPIEDGQEVSIGAGYENDILVDSDEYLSTNHFTIKRTQGRFEACDKNSKNGLFIKLGQSPAEVVPGQVILAGKTTFCIELKHQQ